MEEFGPSSGIAASPRKPTEKFGPSSSIAASPRKPMEKFGASSRIAASQRKPMEELGASSGKAVSPLKLTEKFGASSDTAVSPNNTAIWHGILHTLYKTISAFLYILDFGSNIYTAYQYYQFDYSGQTFEGIGRSTSGYPGQGIFISMVCVMAVGHISCGVVFKLVDFPEVKHRLVWAYFLPFVQLKRVLSSLFNGSSKGNRTPTAKEKRAEAGVESLYGIVSATTDGGPLFLLQYLALAEYTIKYSDDKPWTPQPLLIVSLCLSAVSATWNVARAIAFLVPLPSTRLTLAAGAFTLSVLTVRCTTLVSLLMIQSVPKLQADSGEGSHQFNVMLGIYLLLIFVFPFIGNFFLSREGNSEFNYRTIANSTLRAAGFTYVSISFGPLYPLLSVAQTTRQMGVSSKRFQNRLFFYVAYRSVLEISIMVFLVSKKWSPCLVPHFEGGWVPYLLCPMMPCSLYIVALAVGLVVGVISVAAFMKFLVRVSTTGHSDFQDTTDALYESLGISVDILNCFC